MPSPGEPKESLAGHDRPARVATAAAALRDAQELERAARVPEAIARLESAVALAEPAHDAPTLVEALRRLSVLHMLGGAPADAHREFERALELGKDNAELQARVEQNLGILANIQGELDVA